MSVYFPMSHPMIGNIIPGVKMNVRTRLVTYNDHSIEKLIGRRKSFDPVQHFPDMNNQHGGDHPLIKKLQDLMSQGQGKAPHPHAQLGKAAPNKREGYQAMRDDLQWRK